MRDIVIIGSGGVGKETACIIEEINKVKATYNILGFIDDNNSLWGKEINGYMVLGGNEYLKKNYGEETYVIVAIANYKIKRNIVQELKGKYKFPTLIHPDVIEPSHTTKIGVGSIIYPGVIMTTNISIGNHVIISPKCGIGHDSIIKDYVSLLWNVNISGYDVIEEGVLVGSGATIIQNKRIGQGSTIGAGAVVIADIEKCKTVVGVPAKVIKGE